MHNIFKQMVFAGTALVFGSFGMPERTKAQEFGRINSGIFNAVVQIKTPPTPGGGPLIGTAFLVSPSAGADGRVYLVTNKHMVGIWKCPGDELTEVYDWIDVYFYRSGDPGGQTFKATRVALREPSGHLDKHRVFAHQDTSVDVVAIDIDDEIHKPEEHVLYSYFTASYMVGFDRIDKQLTGVGDLVFALGYPKGITSLTTNHPIAKAAYLASLPGERISIPVPCGPQPTGGRRIITVAGKILIVDGLIQHGNSGSPVLLAGGTKVRHNPTTGGLEFSNVEIHNLVCGIVSFEVVGIDGQPGSGLTAVYSSDYILDVLNDGSKASGP